MQSQSLPSQQWQHLHDHPIAEPQIEEEQKGVDSTAADQIQGDVPGSPSATAHADGANHGNMFPAANQAQMNGGGNQLITPNNSHLPREAGQPRYSLLVPHAPSCGSALSELDVASGKVADPPITLMSQEALQFFCMLTFVTQICFFRLSYKTRDDLNCTSVDVTSPMGRSDQVGSTYQTVLQVLTVVNSALACAGVLISIRLRRSPYLHGWMGTLSLTRIAVFLTFIMWACCALTIGFSTTRQSPWLFCSTRWAAVNIFSCVPLPLLLGCIALRYHRIKSMRRSDHDREVEKQATHEAESLWYILRFNGLFLVPVFASAILGGQLLPFFHAESFDTSGNKVYTTEADARIIVYFIEAILLCFFFFFRYFQREGGTFCWNRFPKSTLVVCTGLMYCCTTIVCINVTHTNNEFNSASSFTEAVGFAALLPIMVTIVDNLLTSNEL